MLLALREEPIYHLINYMPKKNPTVMIHARVETRTREALRKIAFGTRITLSSLVHLALAKFVENPDIDLIKK